MIMQFGAEDNEMKESYFAEKIERRRRFRIAATVAPGILAALLMLVKIISPKDYMFGVIYTDSYLYSTLIIASLSLSAIGLLMIYLQTGFKKASSERAYMYDMQSELSRILTEVQHKNIQDVDKIHVLESRDRN